MRPAHRPPDIRPTVALPARAPPQVPLGCHPPHLFIFQIPSKTKVGNTSVNPKLKALRDAVLGPSPRRVEVGPNGEVRDVESDQDSHAAVDQDQDKSRAPEERVATRLAPRVFGVSPVRTQV